MIADLVHETSTSTGTGNFTTAAVNGKRRLSDVAGTGVTLNTLYYAISNRAAAEWEVGTGHMSAVGTLVRDTVLGSSNGGALVNFSAGTKDVCNDTPAAVQKFAFVPAGAIMAFGADSAPTGWLLCYGQNVSRTTYARLFAVIGTAWGAGDGSTTFTLPDLRGRVIAGQDDMGGVSANRLTGLSGGINGDTFASYGGAESHTLTTAELATHAHSVDMGAAETTSTNSVGHTHGVSITSGTQSANHTHAFTYKERTAGGSGHADLDPTGPFDNSRSTGSNSASHTHSVSGNTGSESQSHTHTLDIPAFNSQNAGSGSAHNNVQPTAIANYIIFAGA